MSIIGKVESLWRYPVKSMRGEELNEAFASYTGIYGDRVFAFRSSANHNGFPYFTARDQRALLQYRPRFRQPDKAARPVNLVEAESRNANPLLANLAELIVDVETPDGKSLAIDDPALIEIVRANVDQKHQVTLMQSQRAMTDCRPVSIFSLQSAQQLAEETGIPVDKRRFRANVYADFGSAANGFAENELVGRSVRIGSKVVITILERDARCMVITLDPDTGEQTPAILKKVAQAHDGMAGVYGAVVVEGLIHKGDSIEVLS
jgi:MOSC domain-containing protein